jgi:hypothetical protein
VGASPAPSDASPGNYRIAPAEPALEHREEIGCRIV